MTDAQFVTEWQVWRAERDGVLAQPYGILSITSINFLLEEPVVIEGLPGRWSTSADGPVLQLAEGERLDSPDGPVTGTVEFGSLVGHPRTLTFGEIEIELFRKDGWDIVRPRDPANPLRTRFEATPAYPPDPTWRVSGRWLPYDSPHPVHIASVQAQLGGPVGSPGEIEFELNGTHRLVAVPAHGAPGHVALLFRDTTSGVTTYPAQRELQVRLPQVGETVELDFNRAYNKNCAYTDFAVCPLPPQGNVLDIAIEAGERIPWGRSA